MEPQKIDITIHDKSTPATEAPVIYRFEQHHLDDPLGTIDALLAGHTTFRDAAGEYETRLTRNQDVKFRAYLSARKFRAEGWTSPEDPNCLLTLSYGESPDVNMQLATLVEAGMRGSDSLAVSAQREIARILFERDANYRRRVKPIDLDCDKTYITTLAGVAKFKRSLDRPKDARVWLVCQAWHAPRCAANCADEGLRVVRGSFVDDFSPSDPQPWVRNWLAWVLKEGTK